MGALATAWQARLSTQQQIALTNADNESATSVNSTILTNAETDASNYFFFKTGLAFDSTNSEHITVAVPSITYFLYSYRGIPNSGPVENAKKAADEALNAFARTRGSLAWANPQTNSTLVPSDENSCGTNLRPYFDNENWPLTPPPSVGGSSDRCGC